jgi:hypothetical protein
MDLDAGCRAVIGVVESEVDVKHVKAGDDRLGWDFWKKAFRL